MSQHFRHITRSSTKLRAQRGRPIAPSDTLKVGVRLIIVFVAALSLRQGILMAVRPHLARAVIGQAKSPKLAKALLTSTRTNRRSKVRAEIEGRRFRVPDLPPMPQFVVAAERTRQSLQRRYASNERYPMAVIIEKAELVYGRAKCTIKPPGIAKIIRRSRKTSDVLLGAPCIDRATKKAYVTGTVSSDVLRQLSGDIGRQR